MERQWDALAGRLGRRARRPVLGQDARVIHDEALEAHANDPGVVRLVVELIKPALALGVAEQVLWREDNEGLAELAVNLRGSAGRGRRDQLHPNTEV